MHSGLYRMAEPVELAPGLLDISPSKAFRLQRAHSAPTGHSLLVDPRRVIPYQLLFSISIDFSITFYLFVEP